MLEQEYLEKDITKDKFNYKQGLIHFSCLIFCICSFFTTPDGDTLFYKFLGLFGISSGINIGHGGVLYIYMFIPLIIGFLSAKKVLNYWRDYGLRFKEYKLKYLPLFIILPVFFLSENSLVQPSVTDSIYYAIIGQRNGVESITYHNNNNNLTYEFEMDTWTCSYDLTFKNNGNDVVNFYVKFVSDWHWTEDFSEILIKDNNGEKKLFTLYPNQKMRFTDEFTESNPTEYAGGGGRGISSVVLVDIANDDEHTPKPLIRLDNYSISNNL